MNEPFTFIKDSSDWAEVRRLAQRLGVPNAPSNEIDIRLANGEVYSVLAIAHALLDRMEAATEPDITRLREAVALVVGSAKRLRVVDGQDRISVSLEPFEELVAAFNEVRNAVED